MQDERVGAGEGGMISEIVFVVHTIQHGSNKECTMKPPYKVHHAINTAYGVNHKASSATCRACSATLMASTATHRAFSATLRASSATHLALSATLRTLGPLQCIL